MQTEYGLIGFPLEHSFSKEYFSEKFKKLGINKLYTLFPISEIEEFPALLNRESALRGLNVSIPYKTTVLKYVHDMEKAVQDIGATNVLKIGEDGHIYAYNTDYIGFEKSFLPLCQANHRKALIFGSGGAALAVAYILKKHHIDYFFVSRSTTTPQSISYQQSANYMQNGYNILINATPLGMFPKIEVSPPIDYHLINSSFLCYDLVYNPRATKFLRLCKAKGATVKDGLEMLCLQADAAWEIWNA